MNKSALLAFGGFALLGCNDPAPKPNDDPIAAAPPVLPTMPTNGTTPVAKVQGQPTPKPVEPVAKLPDDLGGKAVQKSLMPTLTMPGDIAGPKSSKVRITELDRGELPAPATVWKVPSAPLLPKVKPAKPSVPPERAPTDLGHAAAENLGGVKFAEKPLVRAEAPVNAGATDVPAFARQIVERTPVDDPTADISAGKVIETAFPYPVGPLPFLKVTIPDPFEFVEQLKGKLPREKEFGTVPDVVPPEKK